MRVTFNPPSVTPVLMSSSVLGSRTVGGQITGHWSRWKSKLQTLEWLRGTEECTVREKAGLGGGTIKLKVREVSHNRTEEEEEKEGKWPWWPRWRGSRMWAGGRGGYRLQLPQLLAASAGLDCQWTFASWLVQRWIYTKPIYWMALTVIPKLLHQN